MQIDEGEGLLTPAILDELQKTEKFFYTYTINLLENGGYDMTMELEKVKSIAERCTHFGMCKEEYVPQTEFYIVYEETNHKAEGYVLSVLKEGKK